MTAVASPLVNSLMFGMPAFGSLPSILLKSVLLAIASGFAAHRWQKVSLPLMLAVVLFYQAISMMPFRTSESAYRGCCCKLPAAMP